MSYNYLEQLLQTEHGHVMEIGAGKGVNTNVLCDLPMVDRVIVIDPFESCWDDDDVDTSYTEPYPYDRWLENITLYQFDRVHLIQKRSDDKTIFDELKDMGPIIFCFVDGLQKEENIINDLTLLDKLKVKYICLDDWERETELSQVKRGTMRFMETNDNYEILETRKMTESGLERIGNNRVVSFLKRK